MGDLSRERLVTVYNTLGQNEKQVKSSASTWGELQSDFTRQSIEYASLKAVEANSQVTLESKDAVLPEGEFTLFLLPSKVRSGE